MKHCNDRSKPVIFLGSSSNMTKFADVCTANNIQVAGIMDHDYWGNTSSLDGISVIDTEQSLLDPDKLNYYRDNFNFFCASTWSPEHTRDNLRNREKRLRLINTLDQYNLSVISLIDPLTRIASNASIGQGVFVDAFVLLETGCDIQDYASIYSYSAIGHHSKIMRNSVIQRKCSIAGHCVLHPDTYIGTAVKALKTGAVFGTGTFIHEAVYIRRGTVANEIVKMNGDNMSRVRIA